MKASNSIINLPLPSNERIPEPGAVFRHIVPLQIRFNDIDVLGHINNAVYLQFFDLGKTDYLATVMGHDFDMSDVRAVIVNTTCDYYAPTYIHDDIAVVTRTMHIGEHSIAMEQRILCPATGEVKCRCTTVLAGFDPRTATGAPIPAEYAEALRRFEENPAL